MLVNVDHTGPPLKRHLKRQEYKLFSLHWKLATPKRANYNPTILMETSSVNKIDVDVWSCVSELIMLVYDGCHV